MSLIEEQMQIFEALKDIDPISELDHISSKRFKVASAGDVLDPIIMKNDIVIVAGAYFGDEGKGKITDAVASSPMIEVVARMNSGENAGHTVYHDGKKFVFHLIPSAVTIPGKKSVIGPECVMDPVNFMLEEVQSLIDAKVEYKDRLFVGNAHIVAPYHKIMDFALSPTNSSTLMGMSYVHASKVRKRGLRLDDLFSSDKDATVRKLQKDLDTYNALLKQKGKYEEKILQELTEFAKIKFTPRYLFDFLKADDKIEYILELYREWVVDDPDFPDRRDITHMLRNTLASNKKILIESPQSYWLSNATEKHWGSSTSAQTHAAGVLGSSGINVSKYKTVVINVAKTPADSRVGIGANPSSFVPQNYFSSRQISKLDQLGDACINFDDIQWAYTSAVQQNGILKPVEYKDESGKYTIGEAMAIACSRQFGERGATTGKPRVTGVFDCVAAAQVNEAQGPYLSISAIDRGDQMDNLCMTVAYIFHNPSGEPVDSNGRLYKNGDFVKIGDPYPCDNVLKYCHPIIKIIPGWKGSPIAGDKRKADDPLPDRLQQFIGTIEDLTGFEVIGIGNGSDTKEMIYLKRE